MTPIICSFFTPRYEPEAREMEATARVYGLYTDVRAVPDLGDWCSNCGQKPAFIRDMLQKYEGRPVVWVDADARFRKKPDLFDTLDCDFACHYRYGVELLSGTLYFAGTPWARALATAWAEAQMRTPKVWDQRTLQRVIEAGFPVRTQRLPAEYTRVFDDAKMGDAVIEHGQASRRLATSTRAS